MQEPESRTPLLYVVSLLRRHPVQSSVDPFDNRIKSIDLADDVQYHKAHINGWDLYWFICILAAAKTTKCQKRSRNRPISAAYLVSLLGEGEGAEGEGESAQLLLARHAVSLDASSLKQCGPPVPKAGQK
jgi:hypothetical protein